MPPSGNLYGMKVLVANALAEDEGVTFNGCFDVVYLQVTNTKAYMQF